MAVYLNRQLHKEDTRVVNKPGTGGSLLLPLLGVNEKQGAILGHPHAVEIQKPKPVGQVTVVATVSAVSHVIRSALSPGSSKPSAQQMA